jgi:microcystin-dependent protein
MVDPYLGEIRIFAGSREPQGWALCDGRLLSIQENTTLFALLGTSYGGDGVTTFALPDLRGRVPIHQGVLAGGSSYTLGAAGGVETVTLSIEQLPSHNHALLVGAAPGTASDPAGALPAASSDATPYSATIDTTMNQAVIGDAGEGQPHENMLPFLAVNFIIALAGALPS